MRHFQIVQLHWHCQAQPSFGKQISIFSNLQVVNCRAIEVRMGLCEKCVQMMNMMLLNFIGCHRLITASLFHRFILYFLTDWNSNIWGRQPVWKILSFFKLFWRRPKIMYRTVRLVVLIDVHMCLCCLFRQGQNAHTPKTATAWPMWLLILVEVAIFCSNYMVF